MRVSIGLLVTPRRWPSRVVFANGLRVQVTPLWERAIEVYPFRDAQAESGRVSGATSLPVLVFTVPSTRVR